MTKRKYLETTKRVRFWWKRAPEFADLFVSVASLESTMFASVYRVGENSWENTIDDQTFPTAKAAKRHVEEQLGLVCDD